MLLSLFVLAASPAMDVYAQDEVVAMPSAVVVIYHRFGEDTLPSTNISLDQFEAHLRLLQDGNYNVVPLEEVVIALRDGTALPDRTIAITIDDTFRSIYTEAFPRFQVAGFPFTVFVNTDSVDSGQWTVDGGPWTVDRGRWTVHGEPQALLGFSANMCPGHFFLFVFLNSTPSALSARKAQVGSAVRLPLLYCRVLFITIPCLVAGQRG